ncbi:MAG: hypothetical protein MJ252_02670 [archaeon]|nr:hypothetical protein [archaeon]
MLFQNEDSPPSTPSYVCSFCNKNYSNKSNLNVHINTIHHKILPHKCEYPDCNKSFSNLKRKQVHMRTHYGHKPFECEICKKRFNEKIILKNHMKVHSEEKNHKCQHCEKEYKHYYHLKEHIQIKHLNIK